MQFRMFLKVIERTYRKRLNDTDMKKILKNKVQPKVILYNGMLPAAGFFKSVVVCKYRTQAAFSNQHLYVCSIL